MSRRLNKIRARLMARHTPHLPPERGANDSPSPLPTEPQASTNPQPQRAIIDDGPLISNITKKRSTELIGGLRVD